MKQSIKLSIAIVGCALTVGSAALADSPNFKSYSATGTTSAEVIVPPDPLLQSRVVGIVATSDKAGSVLSLRTGVGAYSCSLSNNAGTTITVATTNGLVASDVLVICAASGATNCSATISSFTGTTNVVLAAAVFATVPGDQVYKMSAATTLPNGAATQNYQGEALYVGNKGRPVRCVLDGTSACTINSLTARQE